MALFPVAVITLFWKHDIGLDMAEILLLQGLFGLSMAIFEFPSGYLADRIGYRRTLIWASVVIALGWAGYTVAGTFWEVALAEMALGFGMSLVSGCDTALLYESLLETEEEESYGRWLGRVRFFGQSAEGTAALVAGLLFAFSARLPFVLEVGLWVVNLGVAWSLVEPRRQPLRRSGHVQNVVQIVRTALLSGGSLRAVIVLAILFGLASFLPVWLVPLYAADAGVPVPWLGPIWAVANYTVAVGSLWSDRARRRLGLAGLLLVASVLIAIGYVGLGLTQAIFGFAFYFALTAMRGLVGPALAHREQRLIPSADRAGFLSLRSLLFRLVFLAGAPLVGLAIDARGQHIVLLVVGAVLVPATLAAVAWARSLGVFRDEPSLEQPPSGQA